MRRVSINIGDTFGRLTVKEARPYHKIYGGKKVSRMKWACECECGNHTEVATDLLKTGNTRSCGCLRKETTKKRSFQGYEEIYGIYWNNLKRGALSRNLEFDISIQYVWEMFLNQKRKCKLTGLDIHFTQDILTSPCGTASLDRIDSSKGYIRGNVQWVHKDVNRMKNNLSEDYFISLCKRISENA